jgi:hypothetical protein
MTPDTNINPVMRISFSSQANHPPNMTHNVQFSGGETMMAKRSKEKRPWNHLIFFVHREEDKK